MAWLMLAIALATLVSPSLAAVANAPARAAGTLLNWSEELERFASAREMTGGGAETPDGSFVLPAALREIGESAFRGTSAVTAVLPSALEILGDYAFADAARLRFVYIAPATAEIGAHAFDGAQDLTVAGVAGSFAQRWADRNGFGFAPVTVVRAGGLNLREGRSDEAARPRDPDAGDAAAASRPDRSTGRSEGEVKADHCTGRLALNVRDRFFP